MARRVGRIRGGSRVACPMAAGTTGRPSCDSVRKWPTHFRTHMPIGSAPRHQAGEFAARPARDGLGGGFRAGEVERREILTHTGDVVGTLRYLAPERFDGAGDHRADIYAIGLTLYELLTLRPAFQANTCAKLVEQAVAANPPRPRSIDPTIPRDLETVVLKTIARDPAMRGHQFAAAPCRRLAKVSGRPAGSSARCATISEQFVRRCRRNPAVAALWLTVLFVTTAGAGVASSYFAARRAAIGPRRRIASEPRHWFVNGKL